MNGMVPLMGVPVVIGNWSSRNGLSAMVPGGLPEAEKAGTHLVIGDGTTKVVSCGVLSDVVIKGAPAVQDSSDEGEEVSQDEASTETPSSVSDEAISSSASDEAISSSASHEAEEGESQVERIDERGSTATGCFTEETKQGQIGLDGTGVAAQRDESPDESEEDANNGGLQRTCADKIPGLGECPREDLKIGDEWGGQVLNMRLSSSSLKRPRHPNGL